MVNGGKITKSHKIKRKKSHEKGSKEKETEKKIAVYIQDKIKSIFLGHFLDFTDVEPE